MRLKKPLQDENTAENKANEEGDPPRSRVGLPSFADGFTRGLGSRAETPSGDSAELARWTGALWSWVTAPSPVEAMAQSITRALR